MRKLHLGNPCTDEVGDSSAAEVARPDALFVLNNLGIGGSERKIVRLANRLKDEGVHVSHGLPQWAVSPSSRACAATCRCAKLERSGKFSMRRVVAAARDPACASGLPRCWR